MFTWPAHIPHPLALAPAVVLTGAIVAVLTGAIVEGKEPSSSERAPAGSWIFSRSTFSHAPESGIRVGQYQRIPPVEELPDPRLVTSGYRRTQTTIRGLDGSLDTSYQVQNYGNGRGGLDAEWERLNDAWQQSAIIEGYYWGRGWRYGSPHYGPYGGGPYGGGPYGGGRGTPGGGFPRSPYGPGPYGPYGPGYR